VNGKLIQLLPEEKEELPRLDKKDGGFCKKHVIKRGNLLHRDKL
jgi:hypothetical protein